MKLSAGLFALAFSTVLVSGCIADWDPGAPFPNGQPRFETLYENGVEKTLFYVPNGRIDMVNWRRLFKDGCPDKIDKKILQIGWYPNGQVQEMSGEYQSELELSRAWYANGQQRYDITRKNGQKGFHGRCTWWKQNGQVQEDCEYQDGAIVRDYRREKSSRPPLPCPIIKPEKKMPFPHWQER